MEDVEMDIEEMYFQLRSMAEDEGAYTQEEWNSLVDGVLEERKEKGSLDEDDDTEGLREILEARFEQFEESIPKM